MPDPTREDEEDSMTKVHAYLARIKDQEKEVIAVPDGAGRALCVSSDKHWTLTREWDELHIIAPLVEDEGNDDELDPLTQEGLEHVLQQLAEAKSEASRWEQNYLDADTKAHHATVEADDLKVQVKSEQGQNERLRKALAGSRDAHQRTVQAHETMKRAFDLSQERVLELKLELNAAAEARTAPAVTRAEIEKAVRVVLCGNPDALSVRAQAITDAVWSLVSGADPAVYVVRESDIAAVDVWENDDGLMETPMLLAVLDDSPSVVRDPAANYLQGLAETEALARAIEAEQAVDPIMARTKELLDLAYPGDYVFTGAFETCRKIAEAEARLEAKR